MLRFHYKKIMGDIADALRTRLGTSNRYKVKDIPQSIIDIPSGLQLDKTNLVWEGDFITANTAYPNTISLPTVSGWTVGIIFMKSDIAKNCNAAVDATVDKYDNRIFSMTLKLRNGYACATGLKDTAGSNIQSYSAYTQTKVAAATVYKGYKFALDHGYFFKNTTYHMMLFK